MTYIEKLQKEHPEKVNKGFIGGCNGCPSGVGYGPEDLSDGCIPNEVKCAACWNKVIPGTEEKEYENMSRDELITIIKLLEGRIDTKSELIARYTVACTDKNEKIKELEDKVAELEKKNETYSNVCNIYKSKDAIIKKQEAGLEALRHDLHVAYDDINDLRDEKKELEQKIINLEGACSAKNEEIVRLEKDVENLNQRNDQLTSMLAGRIVGINQLKDKIDGLNVECKNLHYECKTRDKTIEALDKEIAVRKDQIKELEQKLRKSEATCNSYRMMAHSKFGTLNPCNCSGCEEKDKKIDELCTKLELSDRTIKSLITDKSYYKLKVELKDYTIKCLEAELDEEKKAHAKHHRWLGKYFAD